MVRKPIIQLGALAAAAGIAGCAGGNQTRYEALAKELREAPSGAHGAREEQETLEGLEGLERLEREALVRAVLARNPDVESARQAWRAALAAYPQATSLDDPTLGYSFAPLSIGASDVHYGQVVDVRQRLPWPGKLALAGEVALAEAEAERKGYEAARLSLAFAASALFDEYYANGRALELNEEHRELMEDIREAALALFEAGRGSQQDALQVDLELAHIVHQRVVLKSAREVIRARLNRLLHRPPRAPLPPPPAAIELGEVALEGAEELQEQALARRPEMEARRARLEGREAAVELAEADSYPDFTVGGSWNSMWGEVEHRWMVGLSVNVPIQLGRRRGAVEEAEARLQRARSELLSAEDEVRGEVEEARERLREASHVVELYEARLLPAAQAQIEAAQSAYEAGRGGFQALVDAERSLRTLQLQHQEAIAEVGLRRAALERALGILPGLPEGATR